MGYSREELEYFFDKYDGNCHLCGKQLAFKNYGKRGTRGAWQVDHDLPKSLGGSNDYSNLCAACINCNQTKSNNLTEDMWDYHGRNGPPLTREEKEVRREKNLIKGALIGGLGSLVFGATGPVGVIAAVIGAKIGRDLEPDPQKGKRRKK